MTHNKFPFIGKQLPEYKINKSGLVGKLSVPVTAGVVIAFGLNALREKWYNFSNNIKLVILFKSN